MMSRIITAVSILEIEEGYEGYPYRDTEGYFTVGIGKKISRKDAPEEEFRTFPYVPHNVARLWMQMDVESIDNRLIDYRWYQAMNPTRQATVMSMVYQMGITGFLGFSNTIALFKDENYEGAASEMLDSRWARQTQLRAERHASNIETGGLHEYYQSTYRAR